MIFIIKGFRTIVFIVIVIFTTFSPDMSSNFPQVFLVELGNLHEISNHVLHLIFEDRFLWFR